MRKTTLEIPEPLFLQMKRTVVERQQTLRQFITDAIRHELAGRARCVEPSAYACDTDGLPLYRSCERTISDEEVNRIREGEGI
jgi:hypothetical protein